MRCHAVICILDNLHRVATHPYDYRLRPRRSLIMIFIKIEHASLNGARGAASDLLTFKPNKARCKTAKPQTHTQIIQRL